MSFFFFNDTATTEIYTLSLHDALPIYQSRPARGNQAACRTGWRSGTMAAVARSEASNPRREIPSRSEEHTSELQSRLHLVCRLLLEKKKIMIRLQQSETDLSDEPRAAG